jgi:hypothetical protein
MGGPNSGRYGGRPTVESCLILDLNKLLRDRLFRPGHSDSGSLVWTRVGSGEQVGSVAYQVTLVDERGHVRLRYATTDCWTGKTRDCECWIELVTTPQPFGGRRWWFVCPRRGDFVSKLHLPPGATKFASRRAHRLGYASQRLSPRDRAVSRAYELRARLGSGELICTPISKPVGMHWATFEREMAKVEAAEAKVNEHAARDLERMLKHGRPPVA